MRYQGALSDDNIVTGEQCDVSHCDVCTIQHDLRVTEWHILQLINITVKLPLSAGNMRMKLSLLDSCKFSMLPIG